VNKQTTDVVAVLTTTPERWQRLVSAVPADLLSRPAAPGEWSALNCLQHLLAAERSNFPVRYRAFLAGEDFAPFDPNRPHPDLDALTSDQLAAEFARARQDSLTLIERTRDEDMGLTVKHPSLGPVTLAQLLHTWAAHDLMHTVQAERALMQPFMDGCGSWRVFFKDHEVATPPE
jgi:hypothetical protein